jgi:homoserine kinase type II
MEMGSYTKIEEREARAILGLYGLGTPSEVKPLSLGISNSNYCVTVDGERYLLKISNDKGMEDLAQEQVILEYLAEQGFPYSLRPFKTRDQKMVYQWNEYFGVLFPFVEGIPPGPSDITCFEIGQGLAKLHQVPVNTSLRSHETVGFGAKQIQAFINDPACPAPFKDFYNRVFPQGLSEFIEAPFAKTIIHGDLYYDNTLFQHEHLGAILDFEQAGIGEAILDLGISISGTCLEKGRLIAPLIASYVQGYQSVRPLPKIEADFLHQAICLGLFSIALWRIKRFTFGNLNPLMADSYLELLQKAALFTETIPKDHL